MSIEAGAELGESSFLPCPNGLDRDSHLPGDGSDGAPLHVPQQKSATVQFIEFHQGIDCRTLQFGLGNELNGRCRWLRRLDRSLDGFAPRFPRHQGDRDVSSCGCQPRSPYCGPLTKGCYERLLEDLVSACGIADQSPGEAAKPTSIGQRRLRGAIFHSQYEVPWYVRSGFSILLDSLVDLQRGRVSLL
jgi:hypothetical protein